MIDKKIALISGITGQDGSYLTELLLEKGYKVHGIIRRSSSFNTFRIDHLYKNESILNQSLFLHYGDLTDSSNLNRLVEKIQPDEIYNLGAQSHVQVSFEIPEYTAEVDGVGTLRFLDAIRETGNKTKFYQASTSELYGMAQEVPQTEKTPFYPRSPYGVAKLYAYWIVVNYREAYDLFGCNGILFNHESERRGKTFVTRKISVAVAKIMLGLQDSLSIGNLDAKRDWGYAPEYCECMWKMLQEDKPENLIHHSDRGIQYCSNQYTSNLKRKKIQISMTEKDHVYENALAERVNGILKDEFLLGGKLASKKIANRLVSQPVEIYNNERLHMAIGYVTPQQKYAA